MSNTPEFGAGANTFNEVFGATRNPWNTSRSAAGSSGGAAVALATGMAWLAHGSDMGGACAIRRASTASWAFGRASGASRTTPNGHGRHESQPAGADGAQCRGLRAAARRDVRRRPARSALAAAHGRVVSGGGAIGLEAEARRLLARPRHHHGGRRSRGDHPKGGGALRGTGRDGRGGASGFHRPARVLHHAARLRLLHEEGRAAARASRPAQARSDLEYREGLQDRFRRARARRKDAHRAGAALSGVLRPLRSAAHARDRGRAVPDREPLRGRGERPQVRELRRVARHRLRDHGVMRHRAVAALRLHARRTCRSACRSRVRRAAKRASWRRPSRWRICSG